MKLTNSEIYNLTQMLNINFQNGEQKLPIKIGFAIQKNKKTLMGLAQDIEQSRIDIIQNYGVLNEETQQFNIPEDKISETQKELLDLFNIEQEVNICTIKAESLSDNIELTMSQMEAIMFMIEEA